MAESYRKVGQRAMCGGELQVAGGREAVGGGRGGQLRQAPVVRRATSISIKLEKNWI